MQVVARLEVMLDRGAWQGVGPLLLLDIPVWWLDTDEAREGLERLAADRRKADLIKLEAQQPKLFD